MKVNSSAQDNFETIENKTDEVVTEAEINLIDMLRNIEDCIDFVMSASLIAREDKRTEELIDFITEHPEVDSKDVMNYLVQYE